MLTQKNKAILFILYIVDLFYIKEKSIFIAFGLINSSDFLVVAYTGDYPKVVNEISDIDRIIKKQKLTKVIYSFNNTKLLKSNYGFEGASTKKKKKICKIKAKKFN